MIRCSGDLYDTPITEEECLNCALKHRGEQPCGYGYRLLKAMFLTQETRPDIHVTDMTGCALKSFYDKTDPAARYVHDMLVLFLGIAVHDAIDVDDKYVNSEIPVDALGAVGRVDAVYTEDGRIEDAKTTRWMNVTNLPYGSHEAQVNYYNAMLPDPGADKLQIQMIDFSGPTKCRKCKVIYKLIDGIPQCPKCGGSTKNAHL
ncbi:MAG: hypothetical protein KAJ73_03435, partial [Zetaproteobacteria bacterium]|nr:hypothetical protein [Zetaproteobacteria bacterium]